MVSHVGSSANGAVSHELDIVLDGLSGRRILREQGSENTSGSIVVEAFEYRLKGRFRWGESASFVGGM